MSDIESHAKKNIMSPINYGSTITIIAPKRSQMSPFKAMANFTKSKLLKKLKPNIMKSDEETQLIQSMSNDSQMGFSVSSTNIDEDDINTPQNGLSNAGAVFSIVNLFLGLGLLSFPYALMEGSFISLVGLGFACLFMCYTGKLIVRCFEKVTIDKRNYQMVGYEAMGNFGRILIIFGIQFEYIGVLTVSIIFFWKNIEYLIPNISPYLIYILATVLIIPTTWMLNMSELRFISLFGCIAKLLTVIVIILNFVFDFDVIHQLSYDYLPINSQRFSVSMGIYILSCAGHGCLPQVYRSMKNKKDFEKVLNISFIIMFITYASFAFVGYLQYGNNTKIVITGNLTDNNIIRLIESKVLIIFVICSVYFQITPLISVVCEIPEQLLNIYTDGKYVSQSQINIKHKQKKQKIFRTFSAIFGSILAVLFMDNLPILEAITGTLCTMITAVICPALFYAFLYRKEIDYISVCMLITYVCIGVGFALYATYNDILTVIDSYN